MRHRWRAAAASVVLVGLAGVLFWLGSKRSLGALTIPMYSIGIVSVVGAFAVGVLGRQRRDL